MFYPPAKVLVLDVDGGIVRGSLLAKASANRAVSKALAFTPTLKKLALNLVETGETLFGTRYSDVQELSGLSNNYEHIGIITDRSALGLRHILREHMHILEYMSFVQVRCGNLRDNKLKHGPKLWLTEAVKPDQSVLYELECFAMERDIRRSEVLICDDDPEFRFVAKALGFRVYPDDTRDVRVIEFSLPNVIAPAF